MFSTIKGIIFFFTYFNNLSSKTIVLCYDVYYLNRMWLATMFCNDENSFDKIPFYWLVGSSYYVNNWIQRICPLVTEIPVVLGQRYIKVAKSPMSPPIAFPFIITSSGIALLEDDGIELRGHEINTIHCQGLLLRFISRWSRQPVVQNYRLKIIGWSEYLLLADTYLSVYLTKWW